MSSAVRQMPCPDCGSPVQPDREQLCPRCGYPLMFLRQPAEDDARAVPRSPNERDDGTGLVPPVRRSDTRQFPATTYGAQAPAPGQLQCPRCGYGNEPARIRCERCGNELRQARPQAVRLGPPVRQAQPRRAGWGWLIALIILAVLSLIILAATLVWTFLLS
jgi:predicted amidophosphoribosyltransferase